MILHLDFQCVDVIILLTWFQWGARNRGSNPMKYLVIAAALMGSIATAGASAQTVTVYGKVVSDYAFPEFGFVQYDGPVLQGGATATWDNGWFADVWGSKALDGNSAGSEVDYTLGWSGLCGEVHCTFSIAGFDLPTPTVGDADFTGADIVRFRAQIDGNIAIDDSNSLGWMAGIDQLTGLIETNLWRSSVSWNHTLNADWSTSLLVGATYNSDADFTSAYWSATANRSFGNWSANAFVGGYEHQDGATVGAGFSRTF